MCGRRARLPARAAGVDVALYDECKVEPTDESFRAAALLAAHKKVDGYVWVAKS